MVVFTKQVIKHPFIKDLTLNFKEGQEVPVVAGSKIKVEVQNKVISGTMFIPISHFLENNLAVVK